MEHRPSTTPRHRNLFWAALAIPVQLVPCCFSSASVSVELYAEQKMRFININLYVLTELILSQEKHLSDTICLSGHGAMQL